MSSGFERSVWQSHSDDVGEPSRDLGGPHDFPLRHHVSAMNPIPGKTYQDRGGIPQPIFDFIDWQKLCPYETAWGVVSDVLGEEYVSILTSEDAESSATIDLEKQIAKKLVAITGHYVEVDRETGEHTPPSKELVDATFQGALQSGNPLIYLDEILTELNPHRY